MFIKQAKYQEAISDCDWALRVDEKCVKALIHKAKAYTFMKEFDKALELFESVKSVEPKQTTLVEEYIKEMERCRQAYNEEKSVESFLSGKSKTTIDDPTTALIDCLNTKINKPDQQVIYYIGGLRFIGGLCDESRRI